MSKAYQLERLQRIIMDPSFTSGLYLFDTDLADEEIESKIKSSCSVAFRKEEFVYSGRYPFTNSGDTRSLRR